MKTSNKLLLGFLILIIATVAVLLGVARYYVGAGRIDSSGQKISENRTVGSFTGVDVKGNIKVILTQSESPNVKITADKNFLSEITTEVKENVLHISVSNNISRREKIEAHISTNTISSLSVAAGARLESADAIQGNELILECSSGASTVLTLNYRKIEGESSSGAEIKLKGTAGSVVLDASSGAMIDAENLVAQVGDLSGSSGALIKVNIASELSADITSGASIRYAGSPNIKNLNTGSGGTLQKK